MSFAEIEVKCFRIKGHLGMWMTDFIINDLLRPASVIERLVKDASYGLEQ